MHVTVFLLYGYYMHVYMYVAVVHAPQCYIMLYNVHVFKSEMRRKKERSKQGQTNKQGKATQHTQGSHMYMYMYTRR